MAPNLQEPMLIKGRSTSSPVFNITSYINLVLNRDPDKDFRWFSFGDYGLDLYSNGVMVSQKLVKEKPKAVAGLVRAINRAIKETVASPDAASMLITDGAADQQATSKSAAGLRLRAH